jgi:DNA-binding CsgD family transcriptional regulator
MEKNGSEENSPRATLGKTPQRFKIACDQAMTHVHELSRAVPAQTSTNPKRPEQDAVLKKQEQRLKDVSTALKVILQYKQEDKTRLEENVIVNIKTLVLPCIEALKHTRLEPEQRKLVALLEARLEEIVSPYMNQFIKAHPELTPKETQIASLIKDGKTTKEIAQLLHVSVRAIEFHRNNIRKKLGLAHRKTNLRTHLLSQATN